jgi:excisionase family DNA binding protein
VITTAEMPEALAYPPTQAARIAGRSLTRIRKAIREKELTARKDGRATLIERAELQRWLSTLPTIGRDPAQEPTPAPPTPSRSIAKLNPLENNRR